MTYDLQNTYQLIWDQEKRFAYAVAKRVLDKPKISVWIILMPILFLYYAHKIQQYKAGVHGFADGLTRTKIMALDSALEEVKASRRNEEYLDALISEDLGDSLDVVRVRNTQIAEVELLKSHYGKLLRERGASYQAVIKKAYKTGGEYRFFLNKLAKAEGDVHDAVLRAYHPGEEAQEVTRKMQDILFALREEDVREIFG